MLKRLPIFAVAVVIIAAILVAVYYQQRSAVGEGYDIKCVQPGEPPSATNSLTCTIHPSQNAGQGSSKLQWLNVLWAWPEGITAWLLLGTLGAILWQSFATAASAKAALLQIQMMKDNERARIEVRAIGLQVEQADTEFWHLKAGIEIRNAGMGRAYVRQGVGTLIIAGEGHGEPAEPYYLGPLDVVDGFIDPSADSLTESFYFFQTESLDLSDCSQKICDGRLQLYITGFIEYETVGTRFHRDFEYSWVGHDNPLNIGARLTLMDEFKPKTNGDRVSFGYWAAPIGWWMPSKFRENEEYEMEAQKQPKKRHKKAN